MTLPPVLTTQEVADLTRSTPGHWWKMAREGTAPITPLRLGGRQIRWPTAPLLVALGLTDLHRVECASLDELEAP